MRKPWKELEPVTAEGGEEAGNLQSQIGVHLSGMKPKQKSISRNLKSSKSFKMLFLFINSFILFIYYFWLHWVSVAACRLSLVAASGGYSLLRCAGFSLWWPLVAEHRL